MYTNIQDQEIIKDLYYNKQYTVKEIAYRLNLSFWQIYRLMNNHGIIRRGSSEASFVATNDKPKFTVKSILSSNDITLKTAGIMLYWAEGTFLGNTVDFANSNPAMINIFLKFLRVICGVREERLRVYLYAYDYQNIEELKNYWHKVTKIPLSQFTKPFIRSETTNKSKRKLEFGLVHIRYNDKRLLVLLKKWLNEYLDGQVPKWLKGTDCTKAAHNSNIMCKSR